MALVGAGCLAAAGLLALSADEPPPSEVSAGVVAAAEPDPDKDDDKDREKRESSTTSATAGKDRAETTTSTRRRSQTSSSTSTSTSNSTSTTTTTEPEPGSSGATSSTTTTTQAPASTSTRPATTTSTTMGATSPLEPSTTTTTQPSSRPTALITEPAKGGKGPGPVGSAGAVGPEPEARGPRLPTASTGPSPPAAPAGPVPSSAPAASPATSATTAPAVTFESVTPNGIGGADLPDQVQGAPGEVTNPAPAVPTPAKERRPSGVLGMTGSATRTMLMMAGIIMLLGALIIAFGESMTRARGPLPGHTVAAAWGESVPLAPSKREKARRRAGIRPS